MRPWRGRGALRKGCRVLLSIRGSPSWWSPATTVPARHVKRRARTWHRHRTKKSWGTLTLQQVNRCPVVLSVLMNNWRWILKSHLLHSCFPPSAISQQPQSLCSGSERLHCWIRISCVPQSTNWSFDSWSAMIFLAWLYPLLMRPAFRPPHLSFYNSQSKPIEAIQWQPEWRRSPVHFHLY